MERLTKQAELPEPPHDNPELQITWLIIVFESHICTCWYLALELITIAAIRQAFVFFLDASATKKKLNEIKIADVREWKNSRFP